MTQLEPNMPKPPGEDELAQLVRAAVAGDSEAVGGVVERFTPLLMAQARHRLRGQLGSLCEPEDLVNDVWERCLPRLCALRMEGDRPAAILLRYLATALLNRSNQLLRRHLGTGRRIGLPLPGQHAPGEEDDQESGALASLPAEVTGAITRAVRAEARDLLSDGLKTLSESDRELVVMRGIEQVPNRLVAEELELRPNTVAVRYRRALARLRENLPITLVTPLAEGEAPAEERSGTAGPARPGDHADDPLDPV